MSSWRDRLNDYDSRVLQRGPQPSTGTFTGPQMDEALNFLLEHAKTIRDMGESGFDQMDTLVTQLNEFGKSLTKGLDNFQNDLRMETYSETLGGVGVNGNRLGIKVDMLYTRAEEMTEARKVEMVSINS